MKLLNNLQRGIAHNITVPAAILSGAYDIKELKFGQRLDKTTLVLDKGFVVRSANGGMTFTKLEFGSSPVSMTLSSEEARALKSLIK